MLEKQSNVDRAGVRIFPPAVPTVIIFSGVGLSHIWPLGAWFSLPAPWRFWVGWIIVAAASLGLGLWSILLMRRSGQTENPWKPTTEVIEKGPYRLTRNPMYLQMVLISFGFGIILSNLWVLILIPLVVWLLQELAIKPEEAYLEAKFGQTYRHYQSRVRRWI